MASDLKFSDLVPYWVVRENPYASDEDDLGDVSVYFQRKSPTAETNYVLLDVSDGPKTCLNIAAGGQYLMTTERNTNRIGPVTVDGVATSDFPTSNEYRLQVAGGSGSSFMASYPIRYDDSLKIEWRHAGTGNDISVFAFILGSGPHSIAVVKDGEPVYMTAENVGEEQIESMNVPNGYEIARNPGITHEDPQIRGMWDGSKGEVVDHPYWKPFHNTIDKLNGMRRRTGSQAVLEKIEENPTSFENMLEGEIPMEDPVEEAIQLWYEREMEESASLSELDKMR